MEELSVKGIILSAAPQGEYGRRLTLLTDRLGRVTAFASGAAKQGSHIIGAIRPMTAAEFDLAKGRGAWNLHSVRVIDSFGELALDVDLSFYAAYVLELGSYFSESGMPEDEAKALLNLMFVSLKALREKELPPELIRRILELRLLKLSGEYTLAPSVSSPETEEAVKRLWEHVLGSSLTGLYDQARAGFTKKAGAKGEDLKPEEGNNDIVKDFSESVDRLFRRQIAHRFKSLEILEQI